jgi:hypothetical protein
MKQTMQKAITPAMISTTRMWINSSMVSPSH